MTDVEQARVPGLLREEFQKRGRIEVIDISIRAYPDEINYVVYVDPSDFISAAEIGNELDDELTFDGPPSFIIVRKASKEQTEASVRPLTDGVNDGRSTDLMRLISARSRVSEAHPSLAYVRDVDANFSAVTAGRHNLIFGRRGAGKTALLVEAKQKLEAEGALTCWINMQTLRHEEPARVFLYVLEEVASKIAATQQRIKPESIVSQQTVQLHQEIESAISQREVDLNFAARLVPRVQRTLKRFLSTNDLGIYIFIDDFYFLSRHDQPMILDMLHGCVRDCDAWLKIASIRHLTRWFQSSPPLGLQTIHDADLLDLDLTLQDPKRAKQFLEDILTKYFKRVGIGSLGRLFHARALDRLVLASGAVPRDYLVLAGSAIAKAQLRQRSRLVGVQDVNQAAGDSAQVKIQELEDDMASNIAAAGRTIAAMNIVRKFCLEEVESTYFLVGYQEKERHPDLYSVLTELLDVRLIHLVDASVSHPHAAGQRSESFMLDLSQYSGSRLKRGIQVLDLSGGSILSRRTQGNEAPRYGDTPRKVVSILRSAPTLELARFEEIIGRPTSSETE